MWYTQRQFLLILVVLAAAAVGLGVRQWRATYPDLAARLEELDRGSSAATPSPDSAAAGTSAPGPRQDPISGEPGPNGSRLDLNRATTDDLSRLPGVGPVLAARIVAAREAAGRFQAVDDLRGVSGLGRGKLERLRALITVSD